MRPADPRGLLVIGFFAVLAAIVTSAMLFVGSVDEARRSVRHIRVSIEVPLGHLSDTLEADTAGEALLQRAVVATGDQRNELLSQSIAAGEAATKAWSKYRSSALDLPGEAELAATYERDYAAGKAIAGSVLVPIIQSSAPGILPDAQIRSAELDRKDLIALQEVYEREDHASLRSLDERYANERGAVLLGTAALAVIVLIAFAFAMRAARRAAVERGHRADAASLASFEARMIRALEFSDCDDDAFRVAARALTETLPDARVSVVVADSSQLRFTPVVAAPSCGVDDVSRCRASRAGVPLQFNDSASLDSCPVLTTGAAEPCAVTCLPVSVAGTQAAVVQLSGPVGAPPDMGGAVPLIVRRLGDRITAMRAFERLELQAAHDPLTGLLNRRSLEEAVAQLVEGDDPCAVAFADLDHFKLLNDVHGHDVGDRALRAFAATLKANLRPDDLVGRWGGEEFVMVLPGCDEERAVEAMERVRSKLALEMLEGSRVSVTVSVGIAMRDATESLEAVVARADQALLMAKAAGRDRVEVWTPRLDESATAPTAPIAS